MKYKNPVVRGMYPDPSVCRVEDKYYMVCSSFQYFPAVPLFESEDMVNWKQIGHCLTRKSQVDLTGAVAYTGIFAPTIRYHKGRFYMVTTNTITDCNFYVYTDDIYGEWSEPIVVEQDGIDPSLYFEEDKTYFISNSMDEKFGAPCIQMCEILKETGEKLSETKPLWYGTGGRFIEAPHLYKIGAYYYILDSEGGTEYGHMVNYARSKNLWGPFESFEGNPALTNRNLGGYVLQGVGHGDLIEDKQGNWWFMHLGFRQIGKWMNYHHLGRECCLVPVTWKEGWFYIGDGTSRLEYDVSDRVFKEQQRSYSKTFKSLQRDKDWCFLRNYNEHCYEFGETYLKLRGTKDTLFETGLPTFAGIRQDEFEMEILCDVESHCEEAGMTLFLDEGHRYDLYVEDSNRAILRLNIGCVSQKVNIIDLEYAPVTLRIKAERDKYCFYVKYQEVEAYMGYADTKYLSSEVAGGFTGVVLGLYAVDEGNREAVFSRLNIEHKE